MKLSTHLLALSLFASLPAVAEVDLTPRFVKIGGNLIHRAYFADGDKQYSMTIDGDTEISGENGEAVFRFTNVSEATMTLRRTPFPKPAPFSVEALVDYAKAAEAMLPRAAEGTELAWQGENVFPINQWKSYRFTYRYRIGGLGFEESITYLVLDSGQQIVIQTGSQRKDFANISQRADDTVRRWNLVEPGDEKGEN
jgi:hypothetical protein